ncbi:hypothetical protein EB118_15940 [bacterium]|nr:hypothetical protein [bacterium]
MLANNQIKQSRIDICRSCEFFEQQSMAGFFGLPSNTSIVVDKCTVCGCFISLKASITIEKCPKNKW